MTQEAMHVSGGHACVTRETCPRLSFKAQLGSGECSLTSMTRFDDGSMPS